MEILSLDFETYYDKEYSLSKMTTEAYINDPRFQIVMVNICDVDGTYYNLDGAMGMKRLAAELAKFDIPSKPMLAHNNYFDGAILAWKFGIVPALYLDTMCMARATILSETGSASLKKVAEYFRLPPKGTAVHNMLGIRRQHMTKEMFEDYAAYCKHDNALTRNAFAFLETDFPREQLLAIDRVIRMFTQPVINVDPAECIAHGLAEESKVKEAIAACGVDEDTLMSNVKFAAVLAGRGIPVPRKTSLATGKSTFAFSKKDAGFNALLIHPNKGVRDLVNARLTVKSTIERTRYAAFAGIAQRTGGLLPIPLRYYGAHTGRLSGFDDINMQNLKKKSSLRKVPRAPKGHYLMAADQAQIEARINACWSGQSDMVQAFANGEDIYSDYASYLYGYKVTRDTHPDERFIGKTCILGLGFGMGADRLVATLASTDAPIDLPFSNRCVQAYRGRYKMIVDNWTIASRAVDNMRFHASQNDWGPIGVAHESVILPNGLRIHYPDLMVDAMGDTMYRDRVRSGRTRVGSSGEWTKLYGGKLVENCVQAMANIIITGQLVRLSLKWRVVMQEHDKIVFCIPKSALEEARDEVTKTMTTPPPWMPDLPLAIDLKYGETYADC